MSTVTSDGAETTVNAQDTTPWKLQPPRHRVCVCAQVARACIQVFGACVCVFWMILWFDTVHLKVYTIGPCNQVTKRKVPRKTVHVPSGIVISWTTPCPWVMGWATCSRIRGFWCCSPRLELRVWELLVQLLLQISVQRLQSLESDVLRQQCQERATCWRSMELVST